MALPLISTLNNVYINGVINPQWNANGGTFGLFNPNAGTTTVYGGNTYGSNFYGGELPATVAPFVVATSTPSFFGASSYSALNSSFSAKIVVPAGVPQVQTSVVIKHDERNFVEMYVGPNGTFGAYVANGGTPTLATPAFPAYDPVNHAYWRIRNYAGVFYFDVSPDGTLWITLGSQTYSWDASIVTVMFFAGYTGTAPTGLQSFITSVNQNSVFSTISGMVSGVNTASGTIMLQTTNPISGQVSGYGNRSSSFSIHLNIPQGGMTDLAITDAGLGVNDAAGGRNINYTTANMTGSGTITWVRPFNASVPPSPYRDGTYFPVAKRVDFTAAVTSASTVYNEAFTNAQYEQAPGAFNRLSINASLYTESCEYAAQKSNSNNGTAGSVMVTRSKDIAFAGNYSGKMQFGGQPVIDGAGNRVYYPYPTKKAIIPIISNALGQETVRGSVSLSTTRAGTQWYPALVLYDSTFTILGTSTFNQATTPTLSTHPGGGAWQTASVTMPTSPTAAYAGVVPVVIVPGTAPETVYMDAHRIVGITPAISSYPSAFTNPRQLNITLKADRVNYAINSGFNNDINGWTKSASGTSGSPDSLSIAWDGTTGFNSLGSLKASFAVPSGTYTGTASAVTGPASFLLNLNSTSYPIVQGLKVGHTYTISAWIKQSVTCPDITMSIIDANYNGLYGTSLANTINNNTNLVVNGWSRIFAVFTVPPNGGSDYRLWFTVRYPDLVAKAPFNFWVDSILVEETSSLGSYFDGSFPSADYQYELNGSGDTSRSHYYKDFANKLSRVNTIIPQYAPYGSTFSLLSAQPPS